MTHEWKPGDRAMVVVKTQINGLIRVCGHDGTVAGWVDEAALSPLPAVDPLTELEHAVVETAIIEKQIRHAYENGEAADLEWKTAFDAHANAVWAAIAAREPVDPVAELRAAWLEWQRQPWHGGSDAKPNNAYARLERAFAALEAKELK
jgi:hypothetical protein